MEKEELCPKCKSDYLKATDDPRKMMSFLWYESVTPSLEDLRRLSDS
jgi:hypothetical protein